VRLFIIIWNRLKVVHYLYDFKFTEEFLDVHNETKKGHVSQGSDGWQIKKITYMALLVVSYNDNTGVVSQCQRPTDPNIW
jgi:hypothetical protein